MRRSRFTPAEIVDILKSVESRSAIEEVCRVHSISRETLKRWRSRYGHLDSVEAEKLSRLDEENRKLKRELEVLALDNTMLRDLVSAKVATPAARREAVSLLRKSYSVSERRACRAIGGDRSSARYRSRREEPRELLDRIRELAEADPRNGYRRQTERLRAEGFVVNAKRILRLRRLLGVEAKRSAPPARPGKSRSTGVRAKAPKWAPLRAKEGDFWRG